METISEGIVTISTSVDNLSSKADGLSKDGQAVMEQIENVAETSKDNQKSTAIVNQTIGDTVKALSRLSESSESLQKAVANL